MKYYFLTACLFLFLAASSQTAERFNGRWCFNGSRVSLFVAKADKLFFTFVEDHDTPNFKRFISGQVIADSLPLYPVSIDSANGKFFLHASLRYNNEENPMYFVFDQHIDSVIQFLGNVYYDTSYIRTANSNCNMELPTCSNYFYKAGDMKKIGALKPLSQLSKKEVTQAFDRFAVIGRTRCNKCYEGFPGADLNRILINMGYNPTYTEQFNKETVYSTSGFDYIKQHYVGTRDKPIDKALFDHCKKIMDAYWGE